MSTTVHLLTADEFARLPDDGLLLELVRGEVVEMNQPYPRHGQVCGEVYFVLRRFLDDARLGHVVCNDSGVVTERNPDPEEENVRLYFENRSEQIFSGENLVAFPEHLPGFEAPARRFFE